MSYLTDLAVLLMSWVRSSLAKVCESVLRLPSAVFVSPSRTTTSSNMSDTEAKDTTETKKRGRGRPSGPANKEKVPYSPTLSSTSPLDEITGKILHEVVF